VLKGWWRRRYPAHFVVNRDGNRNVPYCNQNGSRWNGNWNWLSNDFNDNDRIAFGNWQ
jgi:hypothetical protein